MENLWKLIKASFETDLHDLSVAAEKEWGELKDKLEGLERDADPDSYVPQEYPKMVGGKTVYNALEEAKATVPAKPTANVPSPSATAVLRPVAPATIVIPVPVVTPTEPTPDAA